MFCVINKRKINISMGTSQHFYSVLLFLRHTHFCTHIFKLASVNQYNGSARWKNNNLFKVTDIRCPMRHTADICGEGPTTCKHHHDCQDTLTSSLRVHHDRSVTTLDLCRLRRRSH